VKVYEILLSAKATDWLEECLDVKLKRRIASAIDGLGSVPRPPGCVKLAGENFVWRIRLGDYRILYEVHDDHLVVIVIRIAKRSEAYR
jgi:mRNA interferase RelE/StbE